jgi:hypothetical protein
MSDEPKAVRHYSRFARAGEANDFNLVKNQSRGHAKKVECSSTSKRVSARKIRQKTLRQLCALFLTVLLCYMSVISLKGL